MMQFFGQEIAATASVTRPVKKINSKMNTISFFNKCKYHKRLGETIT